MAARSSVDDSMYGGERYLYLKVQWLPEQASLFWTVLTALPDY